MYNIKNKSGNVLVISILGITLQVDESRDLAEIASRSRLQDNSSTLSKAVVDGLIVVTDAEGIELSDVLSIQYFCNAYNTVKILNEDTDVQNDMFYILEGEFDVSKGESLFKKYIGKVSSVYIKSTSGDITITITNGAGLKFKSVDLKRRQTYELSSDYKLVDPTIEVVTAGRNRKASVEMYIDGSSTADVQTIQTLIDGWDE